MSKEKGKIRSKELAFLEKIQLYFLRPLPTLVPALIRKYADGMPYLYSEGSSNLVMDRLNLKGAFMTDNHELAKAIMVSTKNIIRPDVQSKMKKPFGPWTNSNLLDPDYQVVQDAGKEGFSRERVSEKIDLMVEISNIQSEKLNYSGSVDVVDYVDSIFSELVSRILVNMSQKDDEYLQATIKLLNFLEIEVVKANEKTMHPLAAKLAIFLIKFVEKHNILGLDSNPYILKLSQKLETMFDQYISNGTDFGVISNLIEGYLKKNNVTDKKNINPGLKNDILEKLLAQLRGLEFAGIATTATLVKSSFALLGQNPEYLEEVIEEVQSVEEDFYKSVESAKNKRYYDVFLKLPKLSALLIEALRLYPPQDALLRQTTEETTISFTNNDGKKENVSIPANVMIMMSVYGIQTDPNYLNKIFTKINGRCMTEAELGEYDPTLFNPDFWQLGTGKDQAENQQKFTTALGFLDVFGQGPHKCVGQHLAILEAIISMFITLKNNPNLKIETKAPFHEYGFSTTVKRKKVTLTSKK